MRAWVGHFELPAGDLERAAVFYRRAFGWRVERVDWSGAPYFKVRTEEGPATSVRESKALQGGLLGRSDAGFDAPLLVVHVGRGELEAVLRRIVDSGGTLDVEPTAVGSMGSFARFRDPEGNLLGLWEGAG